MTNFKKFLFAALAFVMAASLHAQVTTASMSGKVEDPTGAHLQGAIVRATHQPSGTKYVAVTNKDGRYTIQGMRTGGPYKVETSYVGYKTKQTDNIYLGLGVEEINNVRLSDNVTELGEAVVRGENRAHAGASQNFSLRHIAEIPTIDRNIYDVVKTMPLVARNKAGGITIAGQNNRYNSFQIDGTVSNDVFGLASSGTNGGQASANPISMDAIQEIQVVVAPFDVRQSGFTGGAINAITKQGTNEFHGSAYAYYNNQDMYGRYRMQDDVKAPLSKQYEYTLGATLGGPIVKDKLFFFASVDLKKESYPSSFYPGYNASALSVPYAQLISDLYYKRTGIRDLFHQRDVDQRNLGILARIDWNIDDNHKLALRYQHQNAYDDSYSASRGTYTFVNSGYRFSNKTNSFVAELNSRLGDSYYNEFRGSATFVRDHRSVPYQGPTGYLRNIPIKGDFTYDAVTGEVTGTTNDTSATATVNIGTDYSSGLNYLDQDIYNIEDNLSIYKGNHTITIGTHNEIYRMRNGFIQYSNGEWIYDGLAAFIQDAPTEFRYKYTDGDYTNGDLRYAPVMHAAQFGLYAQDKWNILDNLEVTYGLRFDVPVLFNRPFSNAKYNAFAAQNGLPYVGHMPSGNVLFSPRLGFRWFTDQSRKTLVRGGVGIFTGRVPFVWMSNAFTNTGVQLKSTTVNSGDIPTLTQYANDPLAAATGGNVAYPDIVTVDKDFKYPQVFRANLAVEHTFPGDVKLTVEGLYSKNMNAVFFENLALRDLGNLVYAVPGLERSATTYYAKNFGNYASIINTKNTHKGYSYSISAILEKTFDFGLDLKASYTFGHSKSVNDATSSVASSCWQYNYSVRTNSKGELGYAKFDIPHRVMVTASYTTPRYLNGWLGTTIAVTYNGSNGGRYSLTMNESADYNNDNWRGNNLLYIPTDAELAQMNFVDRGTPGSANFVSADESRQKFAEWINGNSYAKNHRGQFAERNSCLTPWEHEVNVHFEENIFLPKKFGKLQVTLDIINFANLLNRKWGASYGNVYNLSPLGVTKLEKVLDGAGNDTGNKNAAFYYNTNSSPYPSDIFSRWHMQVGLRYTF